MAKRIRAIRQTTETYYADDGTVETTMYRVKYLKEDQDDPTLRVWVDAEDPVLDATKTTEEQRDTIEASARAVEGVAARVVPAEL
tara:strand:- start:2857 stop:3111 length:255 start_codon:yes stop_codon:yes gene_type:complete